MRAKTVASGDTFQCPECETRLLIPKFWATTSNWLLLLSYAGAFALGLLWGKLN